MNIGWVERVTQPENCVLGFGIPTTMEGYFESMESGHSTAFVRGFGGYEERYHAEVIAPFNRFATRFRRLGARVVPGLTLARYASLFLDPKAHAIILFSHWDTDFIEFRDGPAGVDAIVKAIPESFAGVIDLCVCHPRKLIPLLRDSHRMSIIHHIDDHATPMFWLYFFRDLFRLLRAGTKSYLEASIELTNEYFKRPQEAQP